MRYCTVGRKNIKHNKNSEQIHCKTELQSSIDVCEQLSCNEVTFVCFCRQDEVMPSRSKTVAVTVEVWNELLQDMMLIVHDSLGFRFALCLLMYFVWSSLSVQLIV